MSEHFFYVSRKKNNRIYKFLVLLNIFCTFAIIALTYIFSYKDFMNEKMHVVEEFLDIESVARSKHLNDLVTFHTQLKTIIEVN